MMITVFSGHEMRSYPLLLADVFRFRHKVFVDQKGWEDLRRDSGLEHDQFDDDDTIHQICFSDGAIVGYQRLRPSLKPHLLSDVLGHFCRQPLPRGPDVWEWSRFCLDTTKREMRPRSNEHFLTLCQGVVEWCLANDIRATTVAIDCRLMVVAMQLRFQARPLGFPVRVGREDVVALELTIDGETLDTIQEARGSSETVLQPCRSLPAALAS